MLSGIQLSFFPLAPVNVFTTLFWRREGSVHCDFGAYCVWGSGPHWTSSPSQVLAGCSLSTGTCCITHSVTVEMASVKLLHIIPPPQQPHHTQTHHWLSDLDSTDEPSCSYIKKPVPSVWLYSVYWQRKIFLLSALILVPHINCKCVWDVKYNALLRWQNGPVTKMQVTSDRSCLCYSYNHCL
jgi:hypothetical protein